ncbi:MAG: TlpA family protein disulfide reductase [Alphaproteobacteria bacterium]
MKRILAALLVGLSVSIIQSAFAAEPFKRFVPASGDMPSQQAFYDADGNPHTLDEYRGKFVVVNIWATWCKACTSEMKSFAAFADIVKDLPVEVLAVSIDKKGVEAVSAYYQANDIDLPIYLSPNMVFSGSLGVRGMPTTVFFDPEGKEIGRALGPENWEKETIVSWVTGLTERG